MKDSLRIVLILMLFVYLLQAYYVIQLCKAELDIIEEDRTMEIADWFTEKDKR